MKFIRIFLLLLIVIGVGLLMTQKLWVPNLVDEILHFEGFDPVAQIPKVAMTDIKIVSSNRTLRIQHPLICDDVNAAVIGKPYVLNVGKGRPDFTFTFYVNCIDVRQNNVLIEKMDQGIDSLYAQFPSRAIRVEDVNTDGYNDIGFIFNEGMAPNYGQVDWYTFNPKANNFVFYEEKDGY